MTPEVSGLPEALASSIAQALETRLGGGAAVVSVGPLSGGCVNDAKLVRTRSGDEFFLKHNPSAPPSLFEAEADGLEALRARNVVRIPEVVAHGVSDGGARGASRRDAHSPGSHVWLLLEYVPAGAATPSYWEELGHSAAALHEPITGEPGYERDNFIGPLTQENEPLADWSEFWVSRRLRPQLDLASRAGLLDNDDQVWREVLDAIREALGSSPQSGEPSLLHGDLWSGNVYPDTAGRPVLIDPAVYRGDPEVDLAMAELFGGFDPAFQRAYRSVRPVPSEYDRVRRRVYQLYPLLVHANLFGAGYAASARANAAAIVSQVRTS